MFKFTATPRQWAELEGLAYWIADNAYCIEKLPREEYEREEYNRHDASILASFEVLKERQEELQRNITIFNNMLPSGIADMHIATFRTYL